MRLTMLHTQSGSSPRMRGTQRQRLHGAGDLGIIPAHAGNTIQGITGEPYERDHPRACGEHALAENKNIVIRGSSPRMRGTRVDDGLDHRRRGIIPAHAGNTYWTRWAGLPNADHPRACGEHHLRQERAGCHRGSSPRMRGTRRMGFHHGLGLGIIPAHAGNTCDRLDNDIGHRDHPRACGEHPWITGVSDVSRGSSPRMRGTRVKVTQHGRGVGIIPAHAGNTPAQAASAGPAEDHPRACGEHDYAAGSDGKGLGSSPRMRGTLGPPQRVRRRQGIIPAHAGNTMKWHYFTVKDEDHPRACGEHFDCVFLGLGVQGSSPRMRGTPISAL